MEYLTSYSYYWNILIMNYALIVYGQYEIFRIWQHWISSKISSMVKSSFDEQHVMRWFLCFSFRFDRWTNLLFAWTMYRWTISDLSSVFTTQSFLWQCTESSADFQWHEIDHGKTNHRIECLTDWMLVVSRRYNNFSKERLAKKFVRKWTLYLIMWIPVLLR